MGGTLCVKKILDCTAVAIRVTGGFCLCYSDNEIVEFKISAVKRKMVNRIAIV